MKNYARLLPVILIGLVLQAATAQTVMEKDGYIMANYQYAMGDNDSKAEAKRICFMEAKRLCLERAGTYLESNTTIQNYQITQDEIRTYSGAIIQVQIISEEYSIVGKNLALDMIVRAKVDVKSLADGIKQIKSDRALAEQVSNQQKQILELEKKIQGFQASLKNANLEQAIELRQSRGEVISELNDLERIKLDIANKTKLAVDNVELGMTPEEVIQVAGEPRSKDECGGDLRYNYGRIWVLFESGVVSCLIRAESYSRCRSRESYKLSTPQAIYK